MWASILAAIAAVPKILGYVKELAGVIKGAVEFFRQARKEKWIDDGREIVEKVKKAKTDEERRKLIKEMAKHDS